MARHSLSKLLDGWIGKRDLRKIPPTINSQGELVRGSVMENFVVMLYAGVEESDLAFAIDSFYEEHGEQDDSEYAIWSYHKNLRMAYISVIRRGSRRF